MEDMPQHRVRWFTSVSVMCTACVLAVLWYRALTDEGHGHAYVLALTYDEVCVGVPQTGEVSRHA